jgi:hypothetical protein
MYTKINEATNTVTRAIEDIRAFIPSSKVTMLALHILQYVIPAIKCNPASTAIGTASILLNTKETLPRRLFFAALFILASQLTLLIGLPFAQPLFLALSAYQHFDVAIKIMGPLVTAFAAYELASTFFSPLSATRSPLLSPANAAATLLNQEPYSPTPAPLPHNDEPLSLAPPTSLGDLWGDEYNGSNWRQAYPEPEVEQAFRDSASLPPIPSDLPDIYSTVWENAQGSPLGNTMLEEVWEDAQGSLLGNEFNGNHLRQAYPEPEFEQAFRDQASLTPIPSDLPGGMDTPVLEDGQGRAWDPHFLAEQQGSDWAAHFLAGERGSAWVREFVAEEQGSAWAGQFANKLSGHKNSAIIAALGISTIGFAYYNRGPLIRGYNWFKMNILDDDSNNLQGVSQ